MVLARLAGECAQRFLLYELPKQLVVPGPAARECGRQAVIHSGRQVYRIHEAIHDAASVGLRWFQGSWQLFTIRVHGHGRREAGPRTGGAGAQAS
jgi:hypothetical protein